MSRQQKTNIFALFFLVAGMVSIFAVPQAVALAGPVTPDSCAVSCGTTATAIKCADGFSSVYVQNVSTTAVAIGDSGLAAPASASSPLICADSACGNVAQWSGDARNGLYCRVDSGTVSLYVLSGK